MTQATNVNCKYLITRELLPPPITSCDVRKGIPVHNIFALSRMSFAHRGRAFLCLCLCAFSLLFISCEHLEDPSHSILEDYFYESQGLKQASNDSIRCFSEKVKTFANCTPSAKNDPLYTRIQENIRLATLRITIKIEDEWAGEKVISFDMVEHESHKSNKYGDPSP